MPYATRPAITVTDAQLRGMRRGVEKESLRTLADGHLAATPHPRALGSKLTHPAITTDFSEALIELVTGAHPSAQAAMDELRELHQVSLAAMGDERLWAYSMPCLLPDEAAIPLADYGCSNVAHTKRIYRRGLALRYGKRMQMIAGIHYNWSLPGLDNDAYFALIRNVRRHVPKLLLLYGASPAVCSCFVEGHAHTLAPLDAAHPCVLAQPHATSLRMGRLGYQSDAQAGIAVSYNCLETYGASLARALQEPYAPYAELGLMGPDGQRQQLTTSLLQIENEFYGAIRPKRVIHPGERPLHALRERGVEYVELRCIDLNPLLPEGIDAATMRVLDLFLLACLTQASPPDTPTEVLRLKQHQRLAAEQGRQPGLRLGPDEPLFAQDTARWFAALAPLAARLDSLDGGNAYQTALDGALTTLALPERLPSARVLAALRAMPEPQLGAWVAAQSAAHRAQQTAQPLSAAQQARWVAVAAQSLAEQARIEAADTLTLDAYLAQYLAPQRLEVAGAPAAAHCADA